MTVFFVAVADRGVRGYKSFHAGTSIETSGAFNGTSDLLGWRSRPWRSRSVEKFPCKPLAGLFFGVHDTSLFQLPTCYLISQSGFPTVILRSSCCSCRALNSALLYMWAISDLIPTE